MSRIYTRTGDEGETGLFGGPRVRKDHPRVVAYGALDELNAVLGLTGNSLTTIEPATADLARFVARVQNHLFDLGAELATPQPAVHGTNLIHDDDIVWLEESIDRWERDLAPLKTFILPGGTTAAAHFHWARTVCRRAERHVVTLAAAEPIRGEVVKYINRLSDALFVAARWLNHESDVPDVAWEPKH